MNYSDFMKNFQQEYKSIPTIDHEENGKQFTMTAKNHFRISKP
jgi:hypothetical protein